MSQEVIATGQVETNKPIRRIISNWYDLEQLTSIWPKYLARTRVQSSSNSVMDYWKNPAQIRKRSTDTEYGDRRSVTHLTLEN